MAPNPLPVMLRIARPYVLGLLTANNAPYSTISRYELYGVLDSDWLGRLRAHFRDFEIPERGFFPGTLSLEQVLSDCSRVLFDAFPERAERIIYSIEKHWTQLIEEMPGRRGRVPSSLFVEIMGARYCVRPTEMELNVSVDPLSGPYLALQGEDTIVDDKWLGYDVTIKGTAKPCPDPNVPRPEKKK